jgi:hypothetical protein
MKFQLCGYNLDILKTPLSCTTLQTVFLMQVIRFCFVNIAVSCQRYPNDQLILNCFQYTCFEKEVYRPYLSAHMNLFMQKILISFKVNGNLKSEIVTVENKGVH